MGLDVYLQRGQHPKRSDECRSEAVELPSAKYPDHLFKIGYFRSSYNTGGINRVLADYGVPDLYDIFGVGRDEYAVTPDWPDVEARTAVALDAFDAAAKRMMVRAESQSPLLLGKEYTAVKSGKDALDVYREETAKAKGFDGGYSNHLGLFVPDGLTVRAFIRGVDALGQPALYFVYDQAIHPSYRQSLEIVQETARWVLAQPDPKAFHLHWSG